MSKRRQANRQQSQSGGAEKWLPTVIVAVISTIGLIIVALINRSTAITTALKPIEFTQTAEARHTAAAMKTQTVITASTLATIQAAPENSTTTPTVSEALTLPSSPTPFMAETIFEDSFIDNRNNWYIDSAFPNITGGKYAHKLSCPSNYVTFYCEAYVLEIPFTFPRNFQMDIETTVLETSPDAHIAIGFQLRRNDNSNFYYINYFIPKAFYEFKILNKGIPFSLIPETSSTLIKTELGATNKFGIEINDLIFTPIINDQRLDQIEDGNFPSAGRSYLVMIIARGEFAIIHFDNLVVRGVK